MEKDYAEQEKNPCDEKFVDWKDYLEAHVEYKPVSEPKHCYEISLHRALYTDELYEVYKKYEMAVHKKERDKDQLKRFVCSSPVYDPKNDDDV
jgi:arginyl-tRNA--protein-N-Asp/Glu arginylyltransferase